MNNKVKCDCCGKDCNRDGYIKIVGVNRYKLCYIEPCDYEVCSFDCGITMLEKQKLAYEKDYDVLEGD
jgi:hypothetical protein